MLENLHLDFSFVTAVSGVAITTTTLLWSLAETKRKLENQFQQSQKELDLTKKDLEIGRLKLELEVKDFFQDTKEIVNTVGSQVDANSGAINVFKSLKTNSTIVQE